MPCLNWKLPLGLLIAGGAAISTARADGFTIVDGQVVYTTQELNSPGDVGVVESGGVIDAPLTGILSTAEGVTIRNAGSVTGSGLGDFVAVTGIANVSDFSHNVIVNSGSVQALATGNITLATGIMVNHANSVINSGQAIGATDGHDSFGTGIAVGIGNNLTNAGTSQGSTVGQASHAAGVLASDVNTIRNTGTISASSQGDLSEARGVEAGSMNVIENLHRISANATGDGTKAFGVSGFDHNSILNEGQIAAAVSGNGANAYGIYTVGEMVEYNDENRIDNAGTVMATAEGEYSSATGIVTTNGNIITNEGSGLIVLTSSGVGSRASGMSGDYSNNMVNSGEMYIRAAGDGGVATGFFAVDMNTIANHGVLDVSALGIGVIAEGLWATLSAPQPGAAGNDILNDGVIRVSAEGEQASARGIGGYNGNAITNTGTLTVQASGTHSNAQGAMFINDGEIYNSGSLLVQAKGTEAVSLGLRFGGNPGTVVNSGRLLIAAEGAGAQSWGIMHMAGEVDVLNSGLLGVTAAGESAMAYGIRAASGFNLTNTGTISASTTGEGSESYGVDAINLTTLTNCGTIIGGTAAVKLEGTDNSLNLCGHSHIEGALLLGEGNALNVDLGRGASAVLHYEGSPTVTVSGAAHMVADNTVAVADPTGLAAEDEMLTDLTRVIADSVDSRLSAARSGPALGAVALNGALITPTADVPPDAAGKVTFWAQALGQTRSEGADGAYDGFYARLGGLMIGADGEVSPSLRAGAFLGASASSLETASNSQTIDANSYFGGLYAGLQKGAPFLNLGITAGWSDQKSNRSINNNMVAGGTEHAKADYDGVFVSPSATLGTDIALPGAVFTPSVRARYAALFLDNSEEHGSATDLSVDSRTVQLFDLRGQLAFAIPVELERGELLLTTRLGADGIFASDSDVNAELLGETIGIQIDSDNTADGFAGLDAAYTTLGGTRFFVTTEFGLQQDSTTTAQATAGVELRL